MYEISASVQKRLFLYNIKLLYLTKKKRRKITKGSYHSQLYTLKSFSFMYEYSTTKACKKSHPYNNTKETRFSLHSRVKTFLLVHILCLKIQ